MPDYTFDGSTAEEVVTVIPADAEPSVTNAQPPPVPVADGGDGSQPPAAYQSDAEDRIGDHGFI